MQKKIYEKQPLSFSDQLQQLKNCNLTVLEWQDEPLWR